MSLGLPDYIRSDLVANFPIKHVWDDWDPFESLSDPDEATKSILSLISNRGISAFSLGCAEWVVGRLSNEGLESIVAEYLDAFWLYLLGGVSNPPPPTNDEDWEGPVLGPINLALMTVLNTIYLSEDGPPVQNGALSAQIALHVLPQSGQSEFLAWQSKVLLRLSILCARDPQLPDGFPVPRVFLDPRVDIASLDQTTAVVQDIERVSRVGNRFFR